MRIWKYIKLHGTQTTREIWNISEQIWKYIKLHGTQNEFNKDMDKYFNTATKEKVIVKIEENKSVVIMPEKIKRQLKRQ